MTMRTAYRVLAYLLALSVAVQALPSSDSGLPTGH